MRFVDSFALGAFGAAKAAPDRDSDGDAHGQPDRDVAREDARRGSDAGAENNAEADLRRRFLHVHLPLESRHNFQDVGR